MKKVFSFGNKKLPKTTAIFNITSAKSCNSAKKNLCQLPKVNLCYALRIEKIYPNVLKYHIRQTRFWNKCEPKEFVNKLLKDKGKRKIKLLRLNESGEFKHQKDVEKAIKIAKLLAAHNIRVYTYTARKDLDFSKRGELIVNGSGFMLDNNFRLWGGLGEPDPPVCKANCRICSYCMEKKKRTINVRRH